MTWFSRLRNWQTDAAGGIGIRADYHDSEDDNFASGINASLNIAGLNSPTSNISMANYKLTTAGLGTAATDYARLDQVQTRVVAYAADSVGTDAYAITLSPALAAYAVGQSFYFAPGTVNTGACTLNINGLGAKPIKKDYNADPSDGDLPQNKIIHVVYDGTNFQMQTPAQGLLNQSLSAIYAADGGGSDSYAITLVPALTTYSTGQLVNFKANTANTGAATININGLGAKSIKKDINLDLNDNDIKASQIVQLIYDGTNFQMLSPMCNLMSQDGHTNYAADGGSNDTYVVTLSPVPGAYKTGMVVNFKANTLNTGAATLNVNSLGAIAIKKFGSTNDIATGDILANQIVSVIYDGTNFQMLSAVDDIANLTADGSPDATADYVKTWDASATTYKKVLLQNVAPVATQSDQETATSTTSYVTPGRQQYHPGSVKAACNYTEITTTAILTSYNITSLSDVATGRTTFTFTTAFSSANYQVATSCYHTDNLVTIGDNSTAPTTTVLALRTIKTSNEVATDATKASFVVSGDF